MNNKQKVIKKNKQVDFEAAVELIGAQMYSQRDDKVTWYNTDEIQSFRRDANMISISFIVQRARRKKNKLLDPLTRGKTVSVLGLENRINYRRRLQKDSVIRKVLEAQKTLHYKWSSTSDIYLAMVSSAATLSARRQALEDGKNISQGFEPDLPLITYPHRTDENAVLLSSNFSERRKNITDLSKCLHKEIHLHDCCNLSVDCKLKEKGHVCSVLKAA